MIFTPCKILHGLTEIEFDNSVLDGDFIRPELLEHESVVSGYRSFVKNGDRSNLLITDYVYKNADTKTRLQTLQALEGELVSFYPDKNGSAIKNKSGEVQDFYVQRVIPIYLLKNKTILAVMIELQSVSYTHIGEYDTVQGYGYQYGQYYGYGL